VADDGSAAPAATRQKHWGVRTLVCLGVAAISIITSNVLYATDNNDYLLVTFLGTYLGIIGAVVCSIRGLRSLRRQLRR
jgi:uncharacterized membrane protein YhiD involved in acid resistance